MPASPDNTCGLGTPHVAISCNAACLKRARASVTEAGFYIQFEALRTCAAAGGRIAAGGSTV